MAQHEGEILFGVVRDAQMRQAVGLQVGDVVGRGEVVVDREVGGGDAERQGQVGAQFGQPVGLGVRDGSAGGVAQQEDGFRAGQGVERDLLRAGQGEAGAGRDDDAAGGGRRQRLHLRRVARVVEHKQDALAGQNAAVGGGQGGRVVRRLRFRVEGQDHLTHGVLGPGRRVALAFQGHHDPAVGVAGLQPLGRVDGQRGLAHPAHPPYRRHRRRPAALAVQRGDQVL